MNVSAVNPLTLPSLPLLQRRSLPDSPALYFVLDNDQVLYVGRATSLLKRWINHYRSTDLEKFRNVKIAGLKCSDLNHLLRIERTLIQAFKPPLNKTQVY